MPRLLLSAFRWFDEALRLSLAARGLPELTHAQSLVMGSLTSDGIRISELARRLDVTRQGAQKSVAGLEEAGLVHTEIDPTNLSARIVRLTETGLRNIETAQEVFCDLEAELTKRIGASHVSDLRHALASEWGDPPVMK